MTKREIKKKIHQLKKERLSMIKANHINYEVDESLGKIFDLECELEGLK